MMQLTQRDQNLILDLFEHKYLTTDQITRLHFSHRKRASRRLRKLEDEGYLKHFEKPAQRDFDKREYVYHLTRRSAQLVAASLDIPVGRIKWRIIPPKSYQYVDHFAALNDFRIALRLAAEKHGLGFEFLPEYSLLRTEIQSLERRIRGTVPGARKSGKLAFVADGVFCLYRNLSKGAAEAPPKKLLFFVEIDRGTEAPSLVLGKISCYCQYFDRQDYKKYDAIFDYDFQGFRVLLVVNDANRMENLLQYVEQTKKKNIDFVWFSHSGRLDKGLLTEPIWRIPYEENPRSILQEKPRLRVKGGHIPPSTNPPLGVGTGVRTGDPQGKPTKAGNKTNKKAGGGTKDL